MIKLNYPEFWNQKGFYSTILHPFSLIYRLLGWIRKIISKQIKFDVPVICVGNATVGGAGKTPMIKALATYYAKIKKSKVLIISKGYGGNFINPSIVDMNFTTCFAGDEAIEMINALYHIGDITVIIAKKVKDAVKLIEQVNPDIILVDDGLQNPGFYKDVLILMVDGLRGFGNDRIIPAGPLRENSNEAINRSDIIISANPSLEIQNDLQVRAQAKFVKMEQNLDCRFLEGEKVFIVSAIGNPERFAASIKLNKKIEIVGRLDFPDHHIYSKNDVMMVLEQAKKSGATKIAVTEKDYVKLKNYQFNIEVVILKIQYNQESLDRVIRVINEKIF